MPAFFVRSVSILFTTLVALAPTVGADAREVRAIWVTRWDFQRASDLHNMVRNAASIGLNRIYLQVRGQADACYRSPYEPWAEELKGDPKREGDPGFDPLSEAIRAAVPADIEIYAWINVLPAWKGRQPPRNRKHLVHTHPEWFMQDANGRRTLVREDRYALLNPCLPAVRDHLARVVKDLTSRYRVDGIQLDYIRFLGRRVEDGEDVPYDARTLDAFRKKTGSRPESAPLAWDHFRRQAVDRLVRVIATTARSARPGIQVSVAAVKDLDRAREHYFQDAPRWTHLGWVDEICPMLYTTDDDRLEDLLRTWKRQVTPSKLVAGLGAYLLHSGRQLHGQVHAARRHDLGGYCVFSYPSCFMSRSTHNKSGADAAESRAQMRKALLISNSRVAAPTLSGR